MSNRSDRADAPYVKRDREHIERALSDASNSIDPALATDARRALDAFRSAAPAPDGLLKRKAPSYSSTSDPTVDAPNNKKYKGPSRAQ